MPAFGSIRRRYAYATAVLISATLIVAVHLHRAAQEHYKRPPSENAERPLSTVLPPALSVEAIKQHGHIAEIIAQTEPGATVMVNGEKAAVIFDGSRIKQFVGPLPDGITVITITAQNEKGGVNTQQVAVALP